MADKELRQCELFTESIKGEDLSYAIKAFFEVLENASQNTFAIFYAPHRCFLAKHNGGDFEVKETGFDLSRVFEARVFNEVSEMRWLNDTNGDHATAILSEARLVFGGKTLREEADVLGGLSQEYLLWGKRVSDPLNGWTRFATARVGAFDVPIETDETYARFKAVEYLKKYKDGNVAVVDERLTGIEGYKGD